jgi:tetratricopeptide (TPR) repeat protein
MNHKTFLSTIVFVLAAGVCRGQIPETANVEGHLAGRESGPGEHDVIELVDQGRVVGRAYVDTDGTFHFRNVAVGGYEIRVVTVSGDVLQRDLVSVRAQSPPIELRVPETRGSRPVSGTVSVRSLSAKVPKNVTRELLRAEHDTAAGNRAGALAHLERAAQECPDCVQVLNNMGVAYIQMGDAERAMAAFRKAVAADPDSVFAQGNLAISLLAVGRYDEAGDAAAHALRLDPSSAAARYAAGASALARRDCSNQTEANLRAAAAVYPKARLAIAQSLLCRGDRPAALLELNAYLSDPKAPLRDKVQSWVAALQQSQQQ